MNYERIPLDQIRPSQRTRDLLSYASPPEVSSAHTYEGSAALPDHDSETAAARRWAHEVFATAQQTPTIKKVRGTVYPFVRSVLLHTDGDWQGQFPNISRREIAELSKYPAMMDIDAYQSIMQRYGITDDDYGILQPRYRRHIAKLSPAYASHFDQGIAEGLLSVPPYNQQIGSLACTVSCFRMIFAGIAADKMPPPTEYAIESYMSARSEGPTPFDESMLFRSLSSPFFKGRTGRTVHNRVLAGATFDDIAVRAEKIKQAYEGKADVYAMLAIKNFDEGSAEALHAVILLNADKDMVTFHNPFNRALCHATVNSGRMGGERETLSRKEFVNRWALGLYTAQLVYALPASHTA